MAAYKQRHARILLLADEGPEGPKMTDEKIAKAVGCGRATVERVRKQLVSRGLEAALERRKIDRSAQRLLDGDAEAHLIALACRLKVSILGVIASFNKGMSGGGYGPIVTGGQILSGVEGKSAVGITSLAEGLTCLVGVITYILVSKNLVDWKLAPWITAGVVFSVPLSAKSVKIIGTKKLKLAIAILTVILGAVTIIKTLI